MYTLTFYEMHDYYILRWICFKRSEAFLTFRMFGSISLHAHLVQLAETQFAYQLMRCKPIFIEQPGLKYPCWQFLYSLPFSNTVFSPHPPTLTLLLSFSLSTALSDSATASLQLAPRPLEILYQWTWNSQQSSGRRSMKKKRRRTGQWKRIFRNSRLSWTAGGTVMLTLITHWQLTQSQNILISSYLTVKLVAHAFWLCLFYLLSK